MSKDGRYPFVQLREAAHTAKIFGFGGEPSGTDMSTPANAARRQREAIELAIQKGIVSSGGTFADKKTVAMALDGNAHKNIQFAISKIRWPSAYVPVSGVDASKITHDVNALVERARKHGVHRGDPKKEKELSEMSTSEQSNTSDPFAADDAGTENVLLMGHAAGLHCLKPKERGEELTATQIAEKYPEQSAELKDAIAAEQTIALARQVGLNCVRPAQ